VGRGIYKTSIDGSAKIPLWIPYHFISGDNLLAKTKVMAFFGDPLPISWINELGDTFIFMELFLIMFAEPRIKKWNFYFSIILYSTIKVSQPAQDPQFSRCCLKMYTSLQNPEAESGHNLFFIYSLVGQDHIFISVLQKLV
jgi:hypothetical protein